MAPCILLVAGEASGDAHAAAVLRALRALDPELTAFGIGGKACAEAGLEVLVPARTMAIAGLTEVFFALPRMWRVMQKLVAAARARRPTVAVLVDLPDFNLRLAHRLRRLGVPVVYYVSPQVWAWREGRVKQIREVVDRMLVILPFEEAYYRARGVTAHFVGHPLVEQLAAGEVPERDDARRALQIGTDVREVVALLPGSRRKEVLRLLPAMLAGAACLLKGRPELHFLLPVASTVDGDWVAQQVAASGLPVQVVAEDSTRVLAACDAAVVCSGTATLQAALVGRPQVVVYRVSALSFAILRRLVRVAHVGLVNLVAGGRLAPELLQKDVRGDTIAGELDALLTPGPRRTQVLEALQGLRARLSERHPAAEVARCVLAYARPRLPQEP